MEFRVGDRVVVSGYADDFTEHLDGLVGELLLWMILISELSLVSTSTTGSGRIM